MMSFLILPGGLLRLCTHWVMLMWGMWYLPCLGCGHSSLFSTFVFWHLIHYRLQTKLHIANWKKMEKIKFQRNWVTLSSSVTGSQALVSVFIPLYEFLLYCPSKHYHYLTSKAVFYFYCCRCNSFYSFFFISTFYLYCLVIQMASSRYWSSESEHSLTNTPFTFQDASQITT